jgi:hypothetical protein
MDQAPHLPDHTDRPAVGSPQLDGDDGNEPDLDGLVEIREREARPEEKPAADRGRSEPDQGEADEPTNLSERAGRDHRYREGHVADGIRQEQHAAKGSVDGCRRKREANEQDANDHVGRSRVCAGGQVDGGHVGLLSVWFARPLLATS